MATACIFIDGENFRKSLIKLFRNDFSPHEYLPKKTDWEGLFNFTASESGCSQRIRSYWYVIEQVDFYPYKFPIDDTERLYRLLSKYEPYKNEMNALQGKRRDERQGKIVEELKKRQRKFVRRFEGWKAIQDGISQNNYAVEFRRAGAIRYNLFDESIGPEKAVDVKLAVDLLELREIYDMAIIVSGDQDYVPAVQVIKDSGKIVKNVCFLTRDNHILPGGARRLNQITDAVLDIKYDDLRKFLFPKG